MIKKLWIVLLTLSSLLGAANPEWPDLDDEASYVDEDNDLSDLVGPPDNLMSASRPEMVLPKGGGIPVTGRPSSGAVGAMPMVQPSLATRAPAGLPPALAQKLQAKVPAAAISKVGAPTSSLLAPKSTLIGSTTGGLTQLKGAPSTLPKGKATDLDDLDDYDDYDDYDLGPLPPKKAISPAAAAVVPVDEPVIVPDINTVDQDGGNWVLKRVWWEQGEEAFSQIIKGNDSIVKAQSEFFAQHTTARQQINAALSQSGLIESDLIEILSYLTDLVKYDGELSAHEKAQRDAAIMHNILLEKLQKKLNQLQDLDESLDDVLAQVVDQIEQSREYEKKAWDNLHEIGLLLNDKKAEELFYEIDAYAKNVVKIADYVDKDLQKYFVDLIARAKTTAETVAADVKALAAAGFDLKSEIMAIREPQLTAEQQPAEPDGKLVKISKKAVKISWLDTIINFWKSVWETLISIPKKLFSFF